MMENDKQHVCKLCNKSFVNGRILGGHMRHHSVQERKGIRCKECGKLFKTVRNLTGHMSLHSSRKKECEESITSSNPYNFGVIALPDAKSVNIVKRKRYHRMRRKFGNVDTANSSSFFSLNETVFGYDNEHEVLDVARSMMMLSKGVYEGSGGFNTVNESFDTDSLSLEAKYLYENKGIGCNEGGADVFNDDDGDELHRRKRIRVENFDNEHEILEGARSMMMLSEGVYEGRSGFKTFHESFDTDSLSFETRSLHDNKEIGCNEGGADAFNDDGDELQRKKRKRVDNFDFDCKNKTPEYGDYDYDMVWSDGKETAFEILVADPGRAEAEGGLLLSNRRMEKEIPDEVDSSASRFFGGGVGLDLETCDTEITSSTSDSDVSKKKGGFQCRICNKFLCSPQSLGGHQTLHRSRKVSAELKVEHCLEDNKNNILSERIDVSSEISKPDSMNDSEEKEKNVMTKKRKNFHKDSEEKGDHRMANKKKNFQCQVCYKFFMSGQALGGHKRTHFTKAKEEQDMAMQQNAPELSYAFNLNLPAGTLNEAGEFKSCWPQWPATSYKNEPLLNVVAT